MTTKRISIIAGAVLAAGIAFGAAGAATAAPSIGSLNPSEIAISGDVTTVSHRFGGRRWGGRRHWSGHGNRGRRFNQQCRPTFHWVRYYGTWVKRFAGVKCFPRYRPYRPYYPSY